MPTLKWSLFCIDSLSKYLLNLHEALLEALTINEGGKRLMKLMFLEWDQITNR